MIYLLFVRLRQKTSKKSLSFLRGPSPTVYTVYTRCPVRCPDWSCSQPTCSKYHGESYESLFFPN